MPQAVLEVRHLERTFDKGRFHAVEDVSFSVAPGPPRWPPRGWASC